MSIFMILCFFELFYYSVFSWYLLCIRLGFVQCTTIIVIFIHVYKGFQWSAFLYLNESIFFRILKGYCQFIKALFYHSSQLHFQKELFFFKLLEFFFAINWHFHRHWIWSSHPWTIASIHFFQNHLVILNLFGQESYSGPDPEEPWKMCLQSYHIQK
jgi:hypothetical protein